MIDKRGYLRLTGRLKELINRGGEKISPLEVDTVIMDHPAVAQVVTFGVPHDKLGEDVAAAVVLREGAACDERELRAFVGSPRRRFQGAAQDRLPDRNSQGRHRQAAAHRPGMRSWPTSWDSGMKIAIFGAGAIGGYLAVKLHQAGADVSVIARGPHLAAMRANGLTLKSEGETVTVRCAAPTRPKKPARRIMWSSR